MAANPMQPWRVEPADVGSASGVYWPGPYSVGRPGDSGPGGPEPGPTSSGGYGPAAGGPPWLGVSRGGSLGASVAGGRGQQLAAYASVPSAATVGDDDDQDGGSERGGEGPLAAVLDLVSQKVERHGSGISGASLGPSDRRGSSTTTIPEIASDAALAELRARIREDTMACRQFVAETEEQAQHLAALRKELEELSVTLSSLHVKRHQTAAEAEEEERRVLDARRLRSQLKKGLHDAQKRVDGAGHRSRAALQQLQKLLAQAAQFVSSEEEAAGGLPLPADADPSDLLVTSSAVSGVPRGSLPTSTAGDFDDSMSCVSDRYSVADDAMMVPAQPPGLVGQLLTWARGVLSIRFVLSLSEISLTVSPGPRRRRKRGLRTQRLRGPPLHEISEAPDAGDEGGGVNSPVASAAPEDPSGSFAQQPALRGSSLHAPSSPTRGVATAASAAAQAAAAVASVGTSLSAAAGSSAPGVSHAAVGSVHELSMRLAARAAATTGGLGGTPDFGNLRPSAFKSGAALSSSVLAGQGGGGPNRFNRLVNMAQQDKPGGGAGVGQSSSAARLPSLQPARAAPQPPQGQQQAGAPLERRGSSDRGGRQPVEVSWPMTPLSQGVSPQSSQERL